MIRFFNTLAGREEEFHSLEPGLVKLYTCGPTVYDQAHIGNFRAYVFEDLLKRFLVLAGYRVFHVMNITDVDDKTIKGARDRGVPLAEYTRPFIDGFFRDNRALNIRPADVYPRATEHIPEMVVLIRGLLERGFAYEREGSFYFSISKFPSYGKLSGVDLGALNPGQRGDADEYGKESINDFALWKKAKPGEPSWDTELGPGRPGWHVECSAMSAKYLGPTFDIHCGGVDNIFPHHENEIAQSEAFNGKPFVRTWLHCHHLIVDGEKMSKSKGNQFTLPHLLEQGADPLDIRWLLLSTHYRKTLNFTREAMEQARSARMRLLDFLYELDHRNFPPGRTAEIEAAAAESRQRFLEGLGQDLNVSQAITAVFELVRRGNLLLAGGGLKSGDVARLREALEDFNSVLAVWPARTEDALPDELRRKVEEREKARRDKNFALADRLRDELAGLGVQLEDSKEGVRWKLRKIGSPDRRP